VDMDGVIIALCAPSRYSGFATLGDIAMRGGLLKMDSAVESSGDLNAFRPPWWLRSAHVQSVLPSLKLRRPLLARRARGLLQASRDHVLDCGAGVRLLGHYSPQADGSGGPRPLALLIHGWEGSAESLYILSLGAHLYEHGFDIFRLNLRDHGPTHHLNEDIFHSCRIAEVVGAVRAVQDALSPASLSLAGFSLGGNFSLRVAARAATAGIRLRKVVAVSPVLSPHRTLTALESGWFVYHRYFVRKWKQSLRIKQRIFPARYDFSDILGENSLATMTDLMVRQHSEYPDMDTYLSGYSILGDALADLRVESHVLLADDDPIIPARDARDLAGAPQLHVKVAPYGGHCGFVDRLGQASWADRMAAQILTA